MTRKSFRKPKSQARHTGNSDVQPINRGVVQPAKVQKLGLAIRMFIEYPSKAVLFLNPKPDKGPGIKQEIFRGVTVSRMVSGGITKEENSINVIVSGCRVNAYYLKTLCQEVAMDEAARRYPSIWSRVRKEALALLSQETGLDFMSRAA
jgi:hypothetical protein